MIDSPTTSRNAPPSPSLPLSLSQEREEKKVGDGVTCRRARVYLGGNQTYSAVFSALPLSVLPARSSRVVLLLIYEGDEPTQRHRHGRAERGRSTGRCAAARMWKHLSSTTAVALTSHLVPVSIIFVSPSSHLAGWVALRTGGSPLLSILHSCASVCR